MIERILATLLVLLLGSSAHSDEALPLFDAHIHYNRDAWEAYPPAAALGLLKQAGVARALVSSTPDEGTVKLFEAEPARIVPELRPYRSPADAGGWVSDPGVPAYLEERLKRGIYKGIGEVHLSAEDAASAVVRRVVDLAVARDLALHVHCDEHAVEALFGLAPKGRILWAHAGMTAGPETVERLLDRHPSLWVELSIRGGDVAPGGRLNPAWRALFLRHPERFLHGTDTWTPSRWDELGRIAQATRQWLAQLPPEVAERIAWRNAEALFGPGGR